MKIKAILTTLFLTIYVLSISQELPPSRISIQIGAAVPLNELAATDSENISSGFAETGFGAAFEGVLFIKKYLATGMRYGYYNMNSKSDLSGLNVDSNATIKVSKPYVVQNIMIGLYYIRPLGEKFSISAKAMVGVLFAITPEYIVSYKFEDASQNYDENIRKGSSSAPGFLLGIGGSYSLSEVIDLSLNVDYSFAKPEFDRTILSERVQYKQKLAILGINVGIAFKL